MGICFFDMVEVCLTKRNQSNLKDHLQDQAMVSCLDCELPQANTPRGYDLHEFQFRMLKWA